MGYKIKFQQVSIPSKETVEITAFRGLCVMYTNINQGNVLAVINGQGEPGIEEIHNNTYTAISIGETGSYLQVTNQVNSKLRIYNNHSGTCLFYMVSFAY